MVPPTMWKSEANPISCSWKAKCCDLGGTIKFWLSMSSTQCCQIERDRLVIWKFFFLVLKNSLLLSEATVGASQTNTRFYQLGSNHSASGPHSRSSYSLPPYPISSVLLSLLLSPPFTPTPIRMNWISHPTERCWFGCKWKNLWLAPREQRKAF